MIIFIYTVISLFIVISLLLFFTTLHTRRTDEKEEEQLLQLAEQWAQEIQESNLSNEQKKRLKDPLELGALARTLNTATLPEAVVFSFVEANQLYWVELGKTYAKQPLTLRAYYAWFCKQLATIYPEQPGEMVELMMDYLQFPSVHCRENTLSMLYQMDSVEAVVEAFVMLSNNEIDHHSKLIFDGLLTFQGDKEALATRLFDRFGEMTTVYQVGVLDFFRVHGAHLSEKLGETLGQPDLETDVLCALLRYFKTQPNVNYKKQILFMAAMDAPYGWEVRAVATSALASYPGEETVALLKQSLQSRNWYIRKNAAIALRDLDVEVAELADILAGEDEYAIEQLNYYLGHKVRV